MGARYIMAVSVIITFCLVMGAVSVALLIKLISVTTFLAILPSFMLIVREITDAYFKRDDRGKNVVQDAPQSTIKP